MKDFKPFDKFGGGRRPRFDSPDAKNPRFNKDARSSRAPHGRDSGRPQLYPARCSQCGAACEVPFRPSGERPVYCRDCFNAPRPGGSGTPQPAPKNTAPHLSRPPSSASIPDKRIDGLKAQLDVIQAKLDMLIKATTTPGVPAAATAAEPVQKKSPVTKTAGKKPAATKTKKEATKAKKKK